MFCIRKESPFSLKPSSANLAEGLQVSAHLMSSTWALVRANKAVTNVRCPFAKWPGTNLAFVRLFAPFTTGHLKTKIGWVNVLETCSTLFLIWSTHPMLPFKSQKKGGKPSLSKKLQETCKKETWERNHHPPTHKHQQVSLPRSQALMAAFNITTFTAPDPRAQKNWPVKKRENFDGPVMWSSWSQWLLECSHHLGCNRSSAPELWNIFRVRESQSKPSFATGNLGVSKLKILAETSCDMVIRLGTHQNSQFFGGGGFRDR